MSSSINKACQDNDYRRFLGLLTFHYPDINNRFYLHGLYSERSRNATALHVSATFSALKFLQCLLSNGANINVWSEIFDINNTFELPIHAACSSNIDSTTKCDLLLKECPETINIPAKTNSKIKLPVSIAAYCGKVDLVTFLLLRGAKPIVGDYKRGLGPLYAAARAGHSDVIKVVLKYYPKLIDRIPEGEESLGTTLHCATYYGNFNTVVELVTHSPRLLLARNSQNKTALDIAVSRDRLHFLVDDRKRVQFSKILHFLKQQQNELNNHHNDRGYFFEETETPNASEERSSEGYTVLTDLFMMRIAEQVVWTKQLGLAIRLHISEVKLENLRYETRYTIDVTFKLLKIWTNKNATQSERNLLCKLREIFWELDEMPIVIYLESKLRNMI